MSQVSAHEYETSTSSVCAKSTQDPTKRLNTPATTRSHPKIPMLPKINETKIHPLSTTREENSLFESRHDSTFDPTNTEMLNAMQLEKLDSDFFCGASSIIEAWLQSGLCLQDRVRSANSEKTPHASHNQPKKMVAKSKSLCIPHEAKKQTGWLDLSDNGRKRALKILERSKINPKIASTLHR